MATIHWFNPENDLALGVSPDGRYTPPRAAVALRQAGALLPSLWAADDDKILVIDPTGGNSNHCHITTDASSARNLKPWGWSRYAAETFRRHGAPERLLPSAGRLDRYRRLSHRDIAAKVLRHIGTPDCLIPVTATSADEAISALSLFGGRTVVKLPWSCSGRGVVTINSVEDKNAAATISNMLRRQGSVTVEPLYDNKVCDFAMLFYKDSAGVIYRGLSVFATDTAGRYSGNIIAPQPELLAELPADPSGLISPLRKALSDLLDDYEGWIGVDMLAYTTSDNAIAIAPCIEVNLRMTMGVAALLAHESGRLKWHRSLLRVAFPSETLNPDSLTFSSVAIDSNSPLTAPVVTISELKE